MSDADPADPAPDLTRLQARLASHRGRRVPGARFLRRAGVAAVVREGAAAGPEILVVRRSRRPGDPWSGDLAFPGGLMEPADADLRATAIRETLEETGLDLATGAHPLGVLSDVLAVTHSRRRLLVIRPFVFRAARDAAAEPGPELDACHWLPIDDLRHPTSHHSLRRRVGPVRVTFRALRHGELIVWGLTYRMLRELLRLR